MLISLFSSNQIGGCVELEISFNGKREIVSAFVDSGNLAIDPMDMSPVILIKKNLATKILPQNIVDLSNVDLLDRDLIKRIRLVPITRGGYTHVLTGVKADRVAVINGDSREEVKATIVIDKEGGTFDGFDALMPSAALDNVFC